MATDGELPEMKNEIDWVERCAARYVELGVMPNFAWDMAWMSARIEHEKSCGSKDPADWNDPVVVANSDFGGAPEAAGGGS